MVVRKSKTPVIMGDARSRAVQSGLTEERFLFILSTDYPTEEITSDALRTFVIKKVEKYLNDPNKQMELSPNQKSALRKLSVAYDVEDFKKVCSFKK